MREISFVKRIKFNFTGSVTKRALVIGDADNDQQNELVCANLQGDLSIFKGTIPDSFASASNLGMVTACAIGDILNTGKNYVTAINMEGWLFIFDVISNGSGDILSCDMRNRASSDSKGERGRAKDSSRPIHELEPIYEQRMPANCKELLLADLDGDGQKEVIIGLTDRVLRTYKWVKFGPEKGKFVGLYKWEFADQIGSVSLNPSRHENCQDIIVAQPGGTYAKLECFDKKPLTSSTSTSGSLNEQKFDEIQRGKCQQQQQHSLDSPVEDDNNVKTEYINKLTPEYHQLALAQMRNHHVSTEVLGSIRDGKGSDSYSLIVLATLDGTLMLANKDEILWSLQVDHQLFALAVLDSADTRRPINRNGTIPQSQSTCTIIQNLDEEEDRLSELLQPCEHDVNSGSQYFVACAWNGKTYIIDEERNYLRFKFGEAVSAFTAGQYYSGGKHHASLVYATFNNEIILYYDVLMDSIRPMYLLKEITSDPQYRDIVDNLERLARELAQDDNPDREKGARVGVHSNTQDDSGKLARLYEALHEVLYNVHDHEIRSIKDTMEARRRVTAHD